MIKNDLLVISNNSLVAELDEIEISMFTGNPREVISRAFSMAASGHELLSHPLNGSVKPNQNPFKSILMSRKTRPVDQQSLKVLNSCLSMTEDMLNDRPLYPIPAEISNDYQLLDFDLLLTSINSLNEGR